MKLAHKFVLLISATSLASLGASLVLVFIFVNANQRDTISTEQLELARQTVDKVDRLLEEKYTEIQTIAGDQTIEQFLRTPQGNVSAEAAQRFDELSLVSGPWDNLELFDANTNLMFSLIKSPLGKDALVSEEQKVYQRALQREISYSDAFYDADLKKVSMLFAAPVYDDKRAGKPVVGVVVGHLAWPAVVEVLASTQGSLIDLYNSHGLEIANKDADYESLLKEDKSGTAVFKKALAQRDGSEVIQSTHAAYQTLTSYATEKGFAGFRGNEWILIIETPTQVAFATALNSAIRISLFLFPITILGGLVLIFFILRFLKPIGFLTAAAQKLAGGDFSVRVEPKSQDEVGALSMAFNSMGEKLKDLYAGLEEKVRERTKELESAKTQDEALLQSIGDGIIATDARGTVMLVNREAGKLLGWKPEEIVGKSIEEIVPVEDRNGARVQGVFMSLQRNVEQSSADALPDMNNVYKLFRKDQTKFPVHIVNTPVMVGNAITGFITVFRDITREKEVDRMKTEFISLASHQLRTPLSSIKWFTEMMLEGDAGPLTDQQKDFAQNVAQSTERMIDLVNGLLNVSRMESGRIMIDPKPTDLAILINGVVTDVRALLKEKEITPIVSIHPNLPVISIDSKMVRQVYINLMTNAIKYTPKGGEISVIVSKKDDMILSQVTDNGYGIPEKEKFKVFQKFYRGENIQKIETVGTGLGLYLVKAIVEASQGKIWFESVENKGTTFWFTLPLAGSIAHKGEVTLDV